MQYAGAITTNANTINPVLSGDPVTTQYCNYGISLQNVTSSSTISPDYGNVTTNNNYINNVYHGILAQNYWNQPVKTQNNNISIFGKIFNFGYGINHTGCVNNSIIGNTITGVSTSGATSAMIPTNRAVYVSLCNTPYVMCNSETNIGRGFEFFQNSTGTQWIGNNMTNNLDGFVLNKAVIGQQGFYLSPIMNNWIGDWSSNAQTYVLTDNTGVTWPYHSKLYCVSGGGSSLDPSNNTSYPSLYHYSDVPSTYRSIFYTASGWGEGAPCQYVGGGHTTGGGSSGMAYIDVATNAIGYAAEDPRGFLAQMMAWQGVITDSSLIDSSVVMDSFYSLASNSRFAYLTNIENALSVGDTQTANQLAANAPQPLVQSGKYYDANTGAVVLDDTDANYIVNNYLLFYQVFEDYITGNLSVNDSANLQIIAGECPLLYGNVVYKARSLYTVVFNQLIAWDDDSLCGTNENDRKGNMNQNHGGNVQIAQHYSLMPNPNNGNFMLTQLFPDTKPIKIAVFNSIGQNVYTNYITFENGKINLNLNNLMQGLYVLNLTDSKGEIYNIKFVVE